MTAPLLDLALSRRIELAEEQAAVDAAETMKKLRPGSGSAVEPILGGFAVYCGANSPVTQAVGLGLHGAVSEAAFARLEAFYRGRKETVRVETSPLADSSLFEQFGKHGYHVTEFTNVMARTLCPRGLAAVSASRATGVSCQKIGGQQVDLWTLTVSEGFAESHPVTSEVLEVMKVFAAPQGGMLSGPPRRPDSGRRDTDYSRRRCRTVRSEHLGGISRPRRANRLARNALGQSARCQLRLSCVPGAAGEQLRAQWDEAGVSDVVYAREVRAVPGRNRDCLGAGLSRPRRSVNVRRASE